MGNLGFSELIVIAVVVVLLFGVKRLPELGSGLGEAISNFRKAYKDGQALDVTPKGEIKDRENKDNENRAEKKEVEDKA